MSIWTFGDDANDRNVENLIIMIAAQLRNFLKELDYTVKQIKLFSCIKSGYLAEIIYKGYMKWQRIYLHRKIKTQKKANLLIKNQGQKPIIKLLIKTILNLY